MGKLYKGKISWKPEIDVFIQAFSTVTMGSEKLLGYPTGKYVCELSLSKAPVQARVVFLSFPFLLTLSIFHYSLLFSAASQAAVKLLVP